MPTAVVTGASRGVGKGVAISLAESGFKVYATGRKIGEAELPSEITRVACNHLFDGATAAVFSRVAEESGGVDLLVNSAWGGYERMVENGKFTWLLPFWEQPMHRWTSMIDAGVRAAFVASAHAAPMMTAARRGLIVNISFWAAQKHIGNTIYGISKAATDKMTADMAVELAPHGVAVVSLYPGMVRTEAVLAAAQQGWLDLSNSESPQFIGLVIAALALDPNVMRHTGKALVAAQLAAEYGITDVDGKRPRPLTLADV
jgi:NAD(P)-dependent dehydrogenase (short-subunit alcohol dehydrogenase family)